MIRYIPKASSSRYGGASYASCTALERVCVAARPVADSLAKCVLRRY
jgi:hypothetical protein